MLHVEIGDVLTFVYHDKPRCLVVEKVATWGVQGACLPHPRTGEEPSRSHSSFNWEKMVAVEKVNRVNA